jgi:hypothetical protein
MSLAGSRLRGGSELNGDTSWFKKVPSWLGTVSLLLAVSVLSAWLVESTQAPVGASSIPDLHPVGAWIVARPESDAQRLGISDAQRAAWEEFKRARWAWVRAAAGLPPFPPPSQARALAQVPAADPRTDGAVVESPAEDAPAGGSRIALDYEEATRRLRAVLSAEQQRTLDETILEAPHRPGHNLRLLAFSLIFVFKPS